MKEMFSKVMLVSLAVAITAAIGSASMALAANGNPFLLGKSNIATKITKLVKDGVGPALDLRVDSGPPLAVNSDEQVENLNADELDGLDSGDFQQSNPCTGGTLFHEGVCIETTRRANATFRAAEDTCLTEGKRLPTVAELQTFRNREGQDMGGFSDWTSDTFRSGADERTVVTGVNNTGRQIPFNPIATTQFRCVSAPG